ncbi:MAG: hypothetical protein QM722_22420 [Piscinibacter sp.]
MNRVAASALAGAALCLGATFAHAEVVDLQWQEGGRFERSLTVAPGKFAEICGPLAPGQTVQWSFTAEQALNFNIHYHVDKDVHYPAKQDGVERAKGDLVVTSRQDYCWMWVNKAASPSRLTVAMTRK